MHELFSQLVAQAKTVLQGNEFFSGGFVLLLLGGAGVLLRKVPHFLWMCFLKRTALSLEITSEQEVFWWLQKWLACHKYTRRARRWLVNSGNRGDRSSIETACVVRPSEAPVDFFPAPGHHLLRYRKRWMHLSYDREPMKMGDLFVGYRETLNIQLFGRDQSVVRQLIQEAYELSSSLKAGEISVWLAAWGSWRSVGKRVPRPLASLVYENEAGIGLLRDVQRFREGPSWYRERDVPYRRGYLLYGPSGNGKSSLVEALAGELGLDLAILMLDQVDSDRDLTDLFLNLPQGCLLLIEDVDKAQLVSRAKRGGTSTITLVNLLNVFDGVLATEGRIIFLTANDASRLPETLTRSGRVDVKLQIDDASPGQIQKMFSRFYGGQDGWDIELARQISARGVSMATLQEHFLRYRENPVAAIRNSQELLARYEKGTRSVVTRVEGEIP